MSDETLKITITAENKSAIEGLKQVSAATQTFVNNQGKLVTGSKQATSAMVDFGRVVNDAPYGLIGMANNFTPLLESFQRLKAETGSGAAALKALGGSLLGAGGLTVALSLVTSAVLIYQNGIAGFNKKTQEAKDTINQFTDSGVQKAVMSVRELETEINLAKNGIIAKDGVVKHYNETIGKTTGLVDNLNEAELKLKQNAPDYIKMQLAKAAANLALAESAKLELEIAELQQKQTQDFGKSGKFGAGMSSAPGFVPGQSLDMGMKARSDANAAEKKRLEDELKKKLADKAKIYEKFTKQNADLMKAHPEWNFFDDTKPPKTYGEAKQKLNLEDFHGKIKQGDAVQIQQHLLDVQKEMLAVSQKQYEVDVKKEALIRLGKPLMDGKFAGTQNATLAGELSQKEAEKKQRLLNIEQSRLDVIANLNNKFKEQKALAESIGGAFQNLFQNIANGANPFETLSNAVKQLVIDLAAAAAKMFLIKAIMTAINPGLGAAKGAGGFLGSIIGGVMPFATGGIVSRPTLGMVGEAGTEAILPLDRFQGMLAQSFQMGSVSGVGNSQQPIILDTRIAGNDIWLTQRRTDFSRGLRTGG